MTAPHPDPTDIVGSLAWIMDRLAAQEEARQGLRLNAAQAAEHLRLPKGYLHGRPWRVPGFGRSGLPPTLGEWESWLSRPEAERRAEWDSLSITERRKARGQIT